MRECDLFLGLGERDGNTNPLAKNEGRLLSMKEHAIDFVFFGGLGQGIVGSLHAFGSS